MAQSIGRGGTITLNAYYRDGTNTLVDPVNPKASIIDANGVTVVNLAAPTAHPGVGHYQYAYPVAANALLGAWAVVWTGTINGTPVEDEDGFTVVVAGSVSTPDSGGPAEGPCDWIDWEDVSDYCTPATIGPALQAAVLRAATRTIWERSCKQFGVCTIDRARVTPRCGCGYTWRTGWGYSPTGGYGSVWPGGCGCSGYALEFIDLGVAPVVTVDHVYLDGVELAAANYRVDDWRRLVRTDGLPWPASTLQPDPGGENTVEVSWTYGIPVPDDGKMAVALLACKLAKEAAGDCEPSANATQIVREGVTITINPPKGDTGIVLVEQWLGNFHCGGGGIFDPGAKRATIRVDT